MDLYNVFVSALVYLWASLVAQLKKNQPAMRETWVRSLGWEDTWRRGMATYSPWGLQRVGHNSATFTSLSLKQNKMPQIRWLKQQTFNFLLVLETGIPRSECLGTFLSSDKGSRFGLQMDAFLLGAHVAFPWCIHEDRKRDREAE